MVDDFVSGGSQLANFENSSFVSSGNVGTIGALGWSTNGLAVVNGPMFGLISIGGTGTSLFNHLRLFPSVNTAIQPFNLDWMPLRTKWVVRSLGLQTNLRVGFMDDLVNATPANGAYFETRQGQWWAVVRDGGIATEFDTGVAVNLVGFYQLLEIRSKSTTELEFKIGGTTRATTLNHPRVGMNFAMQVGGNTGAVLDFASLCYENMQRRIQ